MVWEHDKEETFYILCKVLWKCTESRSAVFSQQKSLFFCWKTSAGVHGIPKTWQGFFLSPTLHWKLQQMWTFHKLKDMHWNFQPCYLNSTKDMDYANIFNLWEMLNLVSHCSILLLGHFWWAITQPNCWCLSYPASNFWQRKPYGFVQSEEIW